jgi:glycosyltransferase involved in cell wall biosynthesis
MPASELAPRHPASAIVAVCVSYTPPSLRHVPWSFDIGGRPALGRLLERLASFFTPPRCVVLNADGARAADVQSIAAAHGIDVCASGTRSLPQLLRMFCETRSSVRSLLLFSDRAIVPDCVESQRMLEWHETQAGAVGIPDDLLHDDLLPIVVRRSAVAPLLAVDAQTSDLIALRTALRRRSAGEIVVARYAPYHSDNAVLQVLPAVPALSDCWSRRAALETIAQGVDTPDGEPARRFKARLLASQDDVPPCSLPAPAPGDRRRRILFSSVRVAYSGGEQSLATLITNLDRSRYVPAAICPFESLLADKLRQAGVPTQVAGWDYTEPTGRNLRFCGRLLETFRPDIVHVDAQPNPSLMTTAFLERVPIVGHLRTMPEEGISPYTHLPDRIIAISDVVAARLRQFNVRPDRVVVVHNAVPVAVAIDVRHGPPQTDGIDRAPFRFAIVSRISPTKKLDVAVDALAHVVNRLPDVRLVVVGEPSAKFGPYAQDDVPYAEALQRRVADTGLSAHVEWRGFEPDIERFYREVDCLIMCNPHEPFGRCGIEALAHGVPVIGPDAGGTLEMIEDGVSGLLFRAGSPADLAAAMIRVAGDTACRRTLAANARPRARMFSVERHLAGIERVYDAVLASDDARPVPAAVAVAGHTRSD